MSIDYLLLLKEDRRKKYPPNTPGVPRLHSSWITEYSLCGWAFYLNHVVEKKVIHVPVAVGSGLHATMEEDNLHKIAGERLSVKDGADIAVAAYDEEISSTECPDSRTDVADGRDLAASGGSSVVVSVSPTMPTPVLVESVHVVTFDTEHGPLEIAGMIDSGVPEGGGIRVHDLKTGKKKTSDWAHGLGQLTNYGILLQGDGHGWPVGYTVDSLRHTRAGWVYEPIHTTRTEADYLSQWERILAVHAAIRAGSFPPAAEGSWNCSAKWCSHFATCKFVSSRRRQSSGPEGDE